MKAYLRYVFGVIAVVLVIVLFVFGFSLLRKAVRSSDSKTGTKTANTSKAVSLTDKDFVNQPVVFTENGAINGNEEHYSVRFTVSPQVRRVEVMQGYDGKIIKTQETANTQDAYNAFIGAISGAGYTKKNTNQNSAKEAESCLLGRRFDFEIAPSNTTNFHSWSTSCSGRQGDFGGNRSLIEQLYERQIPNYDNVVHGIKLS